MRVRAAATMLAVGALLGTAGAAFGTVHAVTTHHAAVDSHAVQVEAGGPAGAAVGGAVRSVVESTAETVDRFEGLGVKWTGPAGTAQLRYRANGVWTDWQDVEVEQADDPSAPSAPAPNSNVSEMVWTGDADAYQVRAPAGATDVHVELVRDHTDTALVPGAQPAGASPVQPGSPPIHSRAEWNARPMNGTPAYGSKAKVVFVHHTVNSNNYNPGDVPGMIAAIQAYHMDSNGWSDIGYNFLVDRYGGIWEGRYGGTGNPVIGAHTGGFNTNSAGVAVLGDFTSTSPTQASVNAVAAITGWKLTLGSQDPFGTSQLTNPDPGGNYENTKYPPPSTVTFNNVSGHRDAWFTECPGDGLYAQLGTIRSLAAAWYPNVIGSLDGTQRIPGGVRTQGWAIDVNTSDPIYAHAYADGQWAAAGLANGARGDIGSAFPAYGPNHGYSVDVPLGPGGHGICMYGINDDPSGPNSQVGCTLVNVSPQPVGSLDALRRSPGGVHVAGWALDPDTAQLIPVHVYSNGAFVTALATGGSRPDVQAAWPAYGPGRGYDSNVATGYGNQQFCAYAINAGPGSNQQIGCLGLNVSPDPFGSLDGASGGTGSIGVGGWAIDPDVASAISVHVYVDGGFATAITAGGTRGDVASFYPDYGTGHGYQTTVGASRGTHQVCVYAINAGAGSNVGLGCRTVSVS